MKKRLIRKITAIAAASILLLSAGCTGKSTQQENTDTAVNVSETDTSQNEEGYEAATIRLGVVTSTSSQWSAEIAKNKGIFEKYGLTVEITEFAAGIETINALTLNQIDLGYVADFGGINRIGNTSDDTDIRFLARLDTNSENGLYVNPERVSDLSDLAGTNIITLTGTSYEYWNAKTLEIAGVSADDVKYLEVDSVQNGLALVESGDADVFWAAASVQDKLQSYGWTSIATQGELGLDTDRFYTSTEEYISTNNDVLVRFFKATQEAYDYIYDNLEDSADILYDATGIDQELFKTSVEGTLVLDFIQQSLDNLTDIKNWAYENGYFENDFDVLDFVDTTALEEALPDQVSYSREK